MKLSVAGLILPIMLLGFFAFETEKDPKYIGANTCVGVCHRSEEQGNQFEVWSNSRHAKAFLTLQTPRADSIAFSLGHATKASETKACVKCHTLGREISESDFLGSFDLGQGVQCESCHGPGSEYAKLGVMKDPEQSSAKGLIVHQEKAEFCTGCHNTESPTYFDFDFDPMWEIIAHPKPK